jgi:SAM-dependent methyltransferase
MRPHVCPWWGGYFIDNPLRRWIHDPRRILSPYVRCGMTVLDFGCGMGLFALAAAELVRPAGCVLAVDLQPQMLAVVRRRAARAGVAETIRTHHCPADSLQLTDPCDFALAFYSVHETPNPRTLFRELRDCLRQDGRLLIVEPRGHVTARDFEQLMTLAGETGFAVHERPRIRWSHAALLRPVAADTQRGDGDAVATPGTQVPPAGDARGGGAVMNSGETP